MKSLFTKYLLPKLKGSLPLRREALKHKKKLHNLCLKKYIDIESDTAYAMILSFSVILGSRGHWHRRPKGKRPEQHAFGANKVNVHDVQKQQTHLYNIV